jgi:hypothetical protein
MNSIPRERDSIVVPLKMAALTWSYIKTTIVSCTVATAILKSNLASTESKITYGPCSDRDHLMEWNQCISFTFKSLVTFQNGRRNRERDSFLIFTSYQTICLYPQLLVVVICFWIKPYKLCNWSISYDLPDNSSLVAVTNKYLEVIRHSVVSHLFYAILDHMKW